MQTTWYTKWLPCLVPELMSSEDSGDDDDGQYVVRPLMWRSEKVTHLFVKLDHKMQKNATVRSRKMMFTRKQGLPSDRPKSCESIVPNWCLK